MTVFRGNSEADPMPGSEEQINRQALSIKRLTPTVISSGPDAGLRQSLADLRKGYEDASKFQSEQDQQAAMQRASVDAQISANTRASMHKSPRTRPRQELSFSAIGQSNTKLETQVRFRLAIQCGKCRLLILEKICN